VDALNRVMVTGATEDEAKSDLCRAVADQKIGIRVRISAADYSMGGRIFANGNVGVPVHLKPSDFDWVQSRPLAQWRIGPKPGQHYAWLGGWENRPIDLIELFTNDVTEVLCRAGNDRATVWHETAAIKALKEVLEENKQLKKADAKELCRKLGHNISERGFQSRVWPQARRQAGLDEMAPKGRKRKS
jgi:hypothetical protein